MPNSEIRLRMEPLDPLSQLASCCFGRRSRNSGGFKTAAMRNQYLYSPSMAHMSPGGGGWPMTASGIAPTTIITGGLHPQVMPTQPYILLTQPVIVNASGQLESLQAHNTQGPTLAILPQHSSQTQIQTVQSNGEPGSLHKVPSIMPSQYNIYATSEGLRSISLLQHQQPIPSLIYESPLGQYRQSDGMSRNVSTYLNQERQKQQSQRTIISGQHQRHRKRLNSELFKRLEIIEKQVDLSEDMDLVERHGIVITRPIEPITLAPHLTNEMLASYQNHFILDHDHVMKFIEIIKRPGQTLGLYIRAVHFENPQTRMVREGIVITKIESDSPVYTSRVIHIGDEILSINLIDIQGMVLDDVVTLMSIPKRLVLVLRIPKEHAEQELSCEMLKRGEPQQHPQVHHDGVPGEPNRLYNQRVVHNSAVKTYESGEIQTQNLENRDLQLAQIPEKRPNFRGSRGQQTQAHLLLVREAQMQSAIREDSINEIPSDLELGPATSGEDASRRATIQSPFLDVLRKTSATRQTANTRTPTMTVNELNGATRIQGYFEQPRSPGVGRLDRQVAISQSIELNRNEDLNRFRNYSMDPEIAKLEQEALIRDRPAGIVASNMEKLDEEDQNQSYRPRLAGLLRKVDQTPSTLPRRTLPTRPDLISPPTSGFPPVTTLNSTIISNIRLGETSEQSNYFTSSIDAINRELKELRRQRVTMSPCNESAPANAASKNAELNFE